MKHYSLFLLILFFATNLFSQELPYKSANKIDATFFKEASKLNKIIDQRTNCYGTDISIILYIDTVGSTLAEPSWDFAGILQIGNYYHKLRLGLDPSIQIKTLLEKIIQMKF